MGINEEPVPDGEHDGVPVRYPGGYRSNRYYPSDEKNYLGNWALGLGVASILCCGLLFGIVAIVLGLQAQAAADQGLATNRGMGTAGITCGVLGFAGALIVLLMQAQMQAHM